MAYAEIIGYILTAVLCFSIPICVYYVGGGEFERGFHLGLCLTLAFFMAFFSVCLAYMINNDL